MLETLKSAALNLVNSLPKCSISKVRTATYRWPDTSNISHLECDYCTFRFGRDVRLRISEGLILELSYSEAYRYILSFL